MFYDLFCELCEKKGVSVTKATVEIGLSRTIGTKWKRTGATPNGDTLILVLLQTIYLPEKKKKRPPSM